MIDLITPLQRPDKMSDTMTYLREKSIGRHVWVQTFPTFLPAKIYDGNSWRA